jgi:transposase-like protein
MDINSNIRDNKGRFIKGQRYHPATEFKKGECWRERKIFYDKDWLYNEYINRHKPAREIAEENGVTENTILFWLSKHQISTRSMVEIRSIKHWGLCGADNPMYGKCGMESPQWKGGNTPLRQRTYSSIEWKELAKQVRIRDKVCRLCGSKDALQIHHIDPVYQSPLFIIDIDNAILLCAKCHGKLKCKENKWRKKLYKIIQET